MTAALESVALARPAEAIAADRVDLVKRTMERFWSHVDRGNCCWVWTGARNQNGYGLFWWHGKPVYAHRFATEFMLGESLGERKALHRCDNPPCVRPTHLFVGTQADNMRDKCAKGRTARGTALPQSKLTDDDVIAIRKAYAAAGVSQRELGRRFGVHQVRISQIVRRVSWMQV